MPYLQLQNIAKRFGDVQVVQEMSLSATAGEFIVLVGASGCGKSTTLRMIAGLEVPNSGQIVIDGRDVTRATPADRNIAMVFQNCALYPHMDVAENMSFALDLAGTRKAKILRRVTDAAKVLSIEPLLKRKPKELSGGQRQRVAMGRAIVREPKVFLFANLQAAVQDAGASEAFMNAASPGVIAVFQPNRHYPSHAAYLEALADAMRHEYQSILEAGLILQIDCPDLAMGRHVAVKHETDEQFLAHVHEQIEALNHALRGLPADRIRMHLCWGNYEGPHHHDIDLCKIFSAVMKAHPQALLFEAANPRHAHEWSVFESMKTEIPADKILIPGVIQSSSNYIEHPELVAQRLERFAAIVGRERVMAGSDCGFSNFAGDGLVDPQIVFAKLRAMADGAALASERLWSR